MKLWRDWSRLLVVAVSLVLATGLGAVAQEEVSTEESLRHAVVCPPFKGDTELATLYHDGMIEVLEACNRIELLNAPRAFSRKSPEFYYRVNCEIITIEDGDPFVTISVVDAARKEQIASYVAPASTEKSMLNSWKKTLRADLARRTAKLPFECRLRHQRGQESYTLDRGLTAGLQLGMRFFVSTDEEPLISQATGELIGRESPRAVGEVYVFRVLENTAYVRPVAGNKLPKSGKLSARTF